MGEVNWPLDEEIEAENEMEDVECVECHDLTSEDSPREAIRETCIDCHEEDEKDYGEVMDRWLKKYGGKLSTLSTRLERIKARATAHYRIETLLGLKSALELLRKAHPIHNIELADEVIEVIEELAVPTSHIFD